MQFNRLVYKIISPYFLKEILNAEYIFLPSFKKKKKKKRTTTKDTRTTLEQIPSTTESHSGSFPPALFPVSVLQLIDQPRSTFCMHAVPIIYP